MRSNWNQKTDPKKCRDDDSLYRSIHGDFSRKFCAKQTVSLLSRLISDLITQIDLDSLAYILEKLETNNSDVIDVFTRPDVIMI